MNLETLEARLHVLIKRLPLSNNPNQQYQQPGNASVAVGTMIPTPGVSQSGNSSLNIPSSMDQSENGGNTMVNTGNFIPNPTGVMHNGSFNTSDGIYISKIYSNMRWQIRPSYEWVDTQLCAHSNVILPPSHFYCPSFLFHMSLNYCPLLKINVLFTILPLIKLTITNLINTVPLNNHLYPKQKQKTFTK